MAEHDKMTRASREFQRYASMTTKELAEATKEFDQEFVGEKSRPLTPEMVRRWERAKRKPGRPRMGKGAKVISVSVEKDLLARSDALARKLKIHRAQLIARGLRAVLASEAKR
jgi:hypothetical protein